MGFCAACGTAMADGARFCPGCGAQAGAAAPAKPKAASSKAASNSSTIAATVNQASDLSPVVEQLKVMYKQKILPLEKDYKFEDFHSPGMTDTDFDAKPMVLLIGQYSTGSTHTHITAHIRTSPYASCILSVHIDCSAVLTQSLSHTASPVLLPAAACSLSMTH